MTDQPDPAHCSCAQHGVTGLLDLLDLLGAGVDQWTASRRLWSPEAEKKPRPRSRRATPNGAGSTA